MFEFDVEHVRACKEYLHFFHKTYAVCLYGRMQVIIRPLHAQLFEDGARRLPDVCGSIGQQCVRHGYVDATARAKICCGVPTSINAGHVLWQWRQHHEATGSTSHTVSQQPG